MLNEKTIAKCEHDRMESPVKFRQDVFFYPEDVGYMVEAGERLIAAARRRENFTQMRVEAADRLWDAFCELENALDTFEEEMNNG